MARPVAPGTLGLSSASKEVAELLSVYGEEFEAIGDCAAADGGDEVADGDDVSPHPAKHSMPVRAIRVRIDLFTASSPFDGNQRHNR